MRHSGRNPGDPVGGAAGSPDAGTRVLAADSESRCASSARHKLPSATFRTQFNVGKSIGFLAVVYLVSLVSRTHAKCHGEDIGLSLSPDTDIYVQYGNPLTIYCSTDRVLGNSSELGFSLAGKPMPSVVVNETTIRMTIEKPHKHSSLYYCTDKVKVKHCLVNVLVDSPPGDVENFTCVSQNLESLNCSWASPVQQFSSIKYTLTFYTNKNKLDACHVERVYDTFYCIWNTTTMPRYRQAQETYLFPLTSCNYFGCHEQNITINQFSVVKPKEPENLTFLNLNPHSVTLRWSISEPLLRFLACGVEHKIEYQIDGHPFRQVNASMLPAFNKTYRFTLSDLPYAYFRYEVRVYVKSRNAISEEFWSDNAHLVFRTASEIPQRAPDVPAGAFSVNRYANPMIFYIYWKQLEEYEEGGPNFTYNISVSQDNKTATLLPEKNKSMSYIVYNSSSNNMIQVAIQSQNINGSSANNSHLYIPAKSEMLEGPRSFTKLGYANGTYELLWDIQDKKIDNYTLFWCRYNLTKVCLGRMNYALLGPDKKYHTIDLPNNHRYQFAISVNRGIQTSGMVWAKCDISKDAANYDIGVYLTYDSPSGSSVVVRWKMECTLRDNSVIGYNITYCPVIDTTENCNETLGTKAVFIRDTKVTSINITGLLYYTTYKFTFILNTTNGPMELRSENTKTVTTGEGVPSNPRNITVTDVSYNSLVISYDPPKNKNGNIVVYIIYNYDQILYNDTRGLPVHTGDARRTVHLTNLKGYTNYYLNVKACNKYCSELNQSEGVSVRTSIGPPGRMSPPNNTRNPDVLEWEPPTYAAGLLDRYQVRRVINDNEVDIFNTSGQEHALPVPASDGLITYQVRAVNIDNDPTHGAKATDSRVALPARNSSDSYREYYGEWSQRLTVDRRRNGTLAMILLYTALTGIMIAIFLGSMKLYKYVQKRKDLGIHLPAGLVIPEKDANVKHTWNPPKEKKYTPCDEISLLPVKVSAAHAEPEPRGDKLPGSDNTDSTGLSEPTPRGRDAETSEEGSECSLDADTVNDKTSTSSASSGEPSTAEKSPFFTKNTIVEKTTNVGNVKAVINSKGYVQSMEIKPQARPAPPPPQQAQPSSYVVASLPLEEVQTIRKPMSMFSPPKVNPRTGYVQSMPTTSKDYVPHEVFINLPSLGLSPGGPAAPPSPGLKRDLEHYPPPDYPLGKAAPPPAKVMSLSEENQDAVINKHLSILSSYPGTEDPAIVDPNYLCAEAYCLYGGFAGDADATSVKNDVRAQPADH